ncbi:MAG: hypothetical protein JF563_01045 [Acidobacteriales bacterium]|nr:hypothetical protein [Terriglobales bacterium]
MVMTGQTTAKSEDKLIEMPAGTAWPIMLAFGVTLCFASLVTKAGIGVAGLIVEGCGVYGLARQVLPLERHEPIPVQERTFVPISVRTLVSHLQVNEVHRAYLPVESYPITSGLRGGIAGGIVMILPALLFGYLTQHSIWYAVNLLGGAGVAHWANATTADIAAFHWNGLIIATLIHAAVCTLIGLLYGAMLPMWPKRPILLGGIIAPLLWTGLLHSILGFVNPAFNARISWGWFTLSEILFGIVAGVVVTRSAKIRTHQTLPFILRMGIETKEFRSNKGDQR